MKGTAAFKYFIASFLSSLFLSPFVAAASDLPSVFKPVPEEYSTPVPPNVLLLIDTSGSMLFDLEGDTTHGDGSKPFSDQYYYGRDTDPGNNDPDDGSLSYYPPVTYLSDEEVSDLRYDTLLGLMGRKGNRYLHPNDSRMYILKKVLWSIFTDPSMVEGLKIGLCTYHQRERYGVPGSGYVSYEFPSYWGGWYWERQRLSWQPTGESKALMRLGLDVIGPFFYAPSNFYGGVPDGKLGTSHWYDLLALIDGVETSENDELRAVGGTPLERSILSRGNNPKNCAYAFIQSEIEYPCQDNWLIVLTDGEDSDPRAKPEDAVEKLYRANLDDPDWPNPYGKKARPVRTFVIGLVDFQSDTLDAMADEGRAWEVDESIKKTAYYATDTDSLLEAFRTIFRLIQNGRSSSVPPDVQTNLSEEGDIVYAASFLPRTDGAWPGYLYKKRLTSPDGYETIWDGSEGLPRWDRRNIYHAPWYDFSGESLSGSNLKRFPTGGTEASSVAYQAGVSDSDSANFVRWVRGGSWNHNSDRVSPMVDLYRGDILLMEGPPGTRSDPDFSSFVYENRSRDVVLFSQGNGGILQFFDDETGREFLGIIPPNLLCRSRLAGLVDNPVEPEMGSSRYLLAGPIVVEDVKIETPYGVTGERYRTILLGSLGYGGSGLYALDVTDPVKPRFIWARDSLVYSDNGFIPEDNGLVWSYSQKGSHLTSGDNAVPSLRRVIGKPFIGWIDDGWERKWLALFGAGAGSTVRSSDGAISFQHVDDQGGRAIYALDVSDGSVFKTISDDRMGQVIADVAVSKGDGRPDYLRISRSYVGDTEGQLWRLNWEGNDPYSWSLDMIGDLADGEDRPPLVHGVDLSLKNGRRWIFAATGDPYDLVPRGSDRPGSNCLVGFKEPDSESGKIAREDLKVLVFNDDLLDEDDREPGWIIPLERGEFSTTPPLIYRGKFFGSTYIASQGNPCEPGIAKLYMLKAFDGAGAFSGKSRSLSLPGIKITGMEVKNGKVVMGVLNPGGKEEDEFDLPEGLGAKMDSDGAVLSIEVPDDEEGGSNGDVMRSGYWRRLW
ncbi:hypothetical protein L2W58_01020 [Dethiosulfovibrio sp. F2B]|uniref:PilC/PilY family type IV pilus protein n=1 Tax=Dethiosulfovibrio faecalis TaxID=2720018 RepID=UPI001F439896|nr:PilC/PilY family type IV pilus protein [Dethiosulfovibrio faecalis]MCF4150387.1 hypothetical protein [Dethiosulfovibrio faecalis]